MADSDSNGEDRTVTRAADRQRGPLRGRRALVARLGKLASFTELRSRVLKEIERSMVEQSFEPGQHLMRQGDDADCLMVVRDGEVEVRVTHDGEQHVLKCAGSGEIFGEMALLTQEPRTADVVALTPVTALVLPVEEFRRIARKAPAIAEVLSRLTALRLGQESHDALSGKIFHGHRIRRPLARGGMSVVYEAEENATGRRVALKMMSHGLVFDEAAKRGFQQEADMIESFDHANIARMFGRFEAFQTFFIVMEFCDGASLSQILRRTELLPVDDVRRILGQLASALQYAHERRIIHRDIKPSNAMVNRDGVVKLMDFGVARELSDGSGDVWGPVTGSAPYLAPEQLAGKSLGMAADLYALAGLTWEMLTGAPLFPSTSFRALRKAHRAWNVPPASSVLPAIDNDLAQFLDGCLIKDPEARSADLKALSAWAGPVRYEDLVEPD